MPQRATWGSTGVSHQAEGNGETVGLSFCGFGGKVQMRHGKQA